MTNILIAKSERTYAEALGWICSQIFPRADIRTAVRSVDARKAVEAERMDLVMLGLSFPDGDGLELILKIVEQHLARHVVVVVEDKNRLLMSTLQSVGVSGILDAASESLATTQEALRMVEVGEFYISPVLRPLLTESEPDTTNLTPTERRVLHIIGMGQNNEQAALVLRLSEATVQTHRRNIMRKLRVTTSAKLVWEAVHLGLAHVTFREPEIAMTGNSPAAESESLLRPGRMPVYT